MAGAHAKDKARLEKGADKLRRALQIRIGGRPLRFAGQHNLQDSGFDGWSIVLATMGQLPKLMLYLDHLADADHRRFWFGFQSSTQGPIDAIVEHSRMPLANRRISNKDVGTNTRGFSQLKIQLSEADARYPIREFYPDDREFFFGIHDLSKETAGFDLNISRAVEFFVETVRFLPSFLDAYQIDCDLEGLPAERRRKEYKRAAQLALQLIRQRKEEGRLVCEDCAFDPGHRIAIGSMINPRSLLDVHHKNPLALGGARWTELSDLQLLCPTCHRLVHAKIREKQVCLI